MEHILATVACVLFCVWFKRIVSKTLNYNLCPVFFISFIKKKQKMARFSHDGTWSMLMVLRFPFFPYQWIFVIIQNRIMYSQQLHMSFWSWNNPSINIVFVSCPKKKKKKEKNHVLATVARVEKYIFTIICLFHFQQQKQDYVLATVARNQ